MTPQAKSAREGGITQEQTPVIIKVGGGGLAAKETTDTIPVVIESPIMDFTDPVGCLTWETAQSAKRGRIIELSFVDGDKPRQDFPIDPSEKLASVKIDFGQVQLVVMESRLAPDDVFLTLASIGVPFHIKTEGIWKNAKAQLPPITRVVFMQGPTVLADYSFEHTTKVDLNVQFFLT